MLHFDGHQRIRIKATLKPLIRVSLFLVSSKLISLPLFSHQNGSRPVVIFSGTNLPEMAIGVKYSTLLWQSR